MVEARHVSTFHRTRGRFRVFDKIRLRGLALHKNPIILRRTARAYVWLWRAGAESAGVGGGGGGCGRGGVGRQGGAVATLGGGRGPIPLGRRGVGVWS